jgi:multidrug efflux system membrane fusion protein
MIINLINKCSDNNMATRYGAKYLLVNLLLCGSISTAIAEEYDSTLLWSQRVELSTPVNGVVHEVFAQTGKIAAKGEVLVQIDPRNFKAQLKYAKANLKSAEQNAQEAKRELDRQMDMYERTMLSDHDLQVAKNNHVSSLALLQQAESELTKANLNLEYSAIRAPFNAVVIDTKAVKGQVVSSEITPPVLVTVAEARRMVARIYVVSDKVSNFVLNQGATVTVAGKTFKGKIASIGMEAENTKSDHYRVDVVFDSNDDVLRAGQKAKVDL